MVWTARFFVAEIIRRWKTRLYEGVAMRDSISTGKGRGKTIFQNTTVARKEGTLLLCFSRKWEKGKRGEGTSSSWKGEVALLATFNHTLRVRRDVTCNSNTQEQIAYRLSLLTALLARARDPGSCAKERIQGCGPRGVGRAKSSSKLGILWPDQPWNRRILIL